MHFSEIAQRLQDTIGSAVVGVQAEAIDPWVEIAADQWLMAAEELRDNGSLAFDYLNCITGIDYLEPDARKAAKVEWEPHVEIVYHLTSLRLRHRLAVKIQLPRWEDSQSSNKAGELPRVPSVASVWSTADWHEREVYDLMGIQFTDHPDPRRILCPEDWVGYPLRKDYEMPLEYHGIRGR